MKNPIKYMKKITLPGILKQLKSTSEEEVAGNSKIGCYLQ